MIVALIPLRGGSKGIPRKNVKQFAGMPLCYWVIKAAKNAKCVNRVVVSTDDKEIIHAAQRLGAEVIIRPKEFAEDNSSTESVIGHTLKHYKDCTDIITIQATNPFTTGNMIDEAFNIYDADDYNSLVTCVRFKRFFWSGGVPVNYTYHRRPMKQEYQGALMENGAFYFTRAYKFNEWNSRVIPRVAVYEMPAYTDMELDHLDDWRKCENRFQKMHDAAV